MARHAAGTGPVARTRPVRRRRLASALRPGLERSAATLVVLASALTLALPSAVRGQTVTSSLPAEGFVDADTPIEVRLDRPLEEGERLALWIGDQDVTSLARPMARGLAYRPDRFPLPSGTGEVRVHLVSGGRWREVGAFPLRVRGGLGFESASFDPRLSLGLDSRLAEHHAPEESAPSRETYADLEGELALETRQAHRAFDLTATAKLVGASYRQRALRFGEEGEEAPRIDLADYTLAASAGDRARLTVGHVRVGDHRHLLRDHGSRGAALSVEAGRRVELSAALVGGSRTVGWDDPFGAGDPDHRIWSAGVGVEATSTPGALRFDATVMGGAVRPRSGFDRGAVVDSETSRGVGLRVRARGLDRRLTLDAGLARSDFDNPEDPALAGDTTLVEVEEVAGVAGYVDASLDVLRGLPLGGRTATLSVGFRQERVNPLYRSVGARVRSDVLTRELDVRTEIAGVTVTATVGSDRDNLDDLPSILTSHTDRTGVTLGLPMERVVGRRSTWLPRIQLRADRTHQFGEALPENGGFQPGHVPDQVSDRYTAGADWRWSRFSLGYRWNASRQDNRQEGREDADLEGSRSALALGFEPDRSLRLGLDLGLERSENLERDEVDEARDVGARVEWTPFQRARLSVRWSRTDAEDRAGVRERTQSTLDARISSAVPGASAVDGQAFLRFSHRRSTRSDAVLGTDDRRETWTVTTGLSLTLENHR